MSRLSKWLRGRKVRLGPIVDWAVRLAEKLLGKGTGVFKKKLVQELLAIIIKYLKEAGKEVPENAPQLVDELLENTVELLNETGTLDAISAEAAEASVVTRPSVPASVSAGAPVNAPTKRRGRPAGSKNKPRADVTGVGPVKLPQPMFDPNDIPEVPDFSDDDIDLTGFDLDESDD